MPSSDTSPRVQKLAELIAYQDSATVSRILLKKPAGNVTLFAFDAGESLSEHTTPYDALVQVLEGQVEISIQKVPYVLHAGDTILMPANQPHALHALERFKMLLTMIHE